MPVRSKISRRRARSIPSFEPLEDRITPVLSPLYSSLANSTLSAVGMVHSFDIFDNEWKLGTGILISPQWVLTAAHCLNGPVQWSGLNFEVGGPGGPRINAVVNQAWAYYPDYTVGGYDLGLFKLERPVTAAEATPIPVWRGTLPVGQPMWLVGFGVTGNGVSGQTPNTSGTKRAGIMYVDGHEQTSYRIRFDRGESFMGEGDSGGPGLITRTENGRTVYYVAAVVSGGEDVPNQTYGDSGWMMRMDYFGAWVDQHAFGVIPPGGIRFINGPGSVSMPGLVDQNAPEIQGLPTAPIEVAVPAFSEGTEVEFGPISAIDDYDFEPTLVLSHPSGSFFPIGTTVVEVTASDVSGNRRVASFEVVVQPPPGPTYPSPPMLYFVEDDSGILGDGITSVRTPRLVGTASPGRIVELVRDSVVLGLAISDDAGRYEIVPQGPLEEGITELTVRVLDDVWGTIESEPSFIVIDTTPLAIAEVVAEERDAIRHPVEFATVFFYEPIQGGLGADALRLTRDGEPVSLEGVSIQAVDLATYYVSGLGPLTSGTGRYELRVETKGLTDLAGNGGVGDAVVGFEVDVTPPTVVAMVAVGRGSDRAPIGVIEISFSENMDLTSLGQSSFSLSRDGQIIALEGISVERVNGSTVRVHGFGPLTSRSGRYQLQVGIEGVRDVAGNPIAEGATTLLTFRQTVNGDYDGDGMTDLALFAAAHHDPFAGGTTAIFELELSNWGSPVSRSFTIPGVGPNVIPISGDFDGDGIMDVAVVDPMARLGGGEEPNASLWIILDSSENGARREIPFGAAGILDRPAPADYDGDGKTDLATFRANSDLTPDAAEWFILGSSAGAFRVAFGAANGVDLPAPADYDGDGRDDIVTFRPRPHPFDEARGISGVAQWFVIPSSFNDPQFRERAGAFPVVFGAAGNADQPAPFDYDGDGRADLMAFRSVSDQPDAAGRADWFLLQSAWNDSRYTSSPPPGGRRVTFGNAGDISATGDYDGDGRPDVAVFRPTDRTWIVRSGLDGPERTLVFGMPGMNSVPVLAPLYFRLWATGNAPAGDPTALSAWRSNAGFAFSPTMTDPRALASAAALSYASLPVSVGSVNESPNDEGWEDLFDQALGDLSNGQDA